MAVAWQEPIQSQCVHGCATRLQTNQTYESTFFVAYKLAQLFFLLALPHVSSSLVPLSFTQFKPMKTALIHPQNQLPSLPPFPSQPPPPETPITFSSLCPESTKSGSRPHRTVHDATIPTTTTATPTETRRPLPLLQSKHDRPHEMRSTSACVLPSCWMTVSIAALLSAVSGTRCCPSSDADRARPMLPATAMLPPACAP